MPRIDLMEQHARARARLATRVPISIPRDDTRDAADHRVVYVLAFGITGAIVGNALVFVYFALFYAPG